MRFSKNWLLQWVNPKKTTAELCQQFTDAGLEVDFYEPAAPAFSGVIIAQITQAKAHPDAEKLQICTVDDGKTSLQIVCGANNARAGLKVALATVGAVLPGDFEIKPAKLRGVESYGMLCAEAELGLAEVSSGIMELPDDAPIGEDIREYLELNDEIIDIDLTPNRGDCFSLRGLAREIGVINELNVSEPKIQAIQPAIEETFEIEIKVPEACPRYCARVIKDIDIHVNTPLWLQERLRRSGIRSINPVVDVTNFVMLALGQPMHAFDLEKIQDKIIVRYAKEGESITLLDERKIELNKDTLVIADTKAALAIAGIMGGASSGVGSDTTSILLESAFFNPLTIMGKPRRYNAHTDSSHRFERGVDPNISISAMEYATQLIIDICGGKAAVICQQVSEDDLPKRNTIELRRKQISRILGLEVSDDKVTDILQRLGMNVTNTEHGWSVIPPSYRFDLGLEVDLIEEIARIVGFEHIPSTPPVDELVMLTASEKKLDANDLRQQLVAQGYNETISYSFVDPKMQSLLLPSEETIALQNPISQEMSVMRSSIWVNLITAVASNQKYQQDRVRLFEIGRVYQTGKDAVAQPVKLAAVISGTRYPEQWGANSEKVDFYDAKSEVQRLLPGARFDIGRHEALHPGQSAQIILAGQTVGWLGMLHPRISQQLKIVGNVALFEIDLGKVEQKIVPQYQHVSKYPLIHRDLAIVVHEGVTFQQVYDIVHNSAGDLLVAMDVFDLYRGPGIADKHKSLAIRLSLQHAQRTLVEDEVIQVVQKVVESLRNNAQAELRE